ncbi:glutathione-regulated potassium-efflux system ancillary protein KefG [Vibrio sp. V39_P1S14PM300]|nr:MULTISPECIES: glutathione-regulated potassium-efflux system ancillary protein KefG [unclassified Vibrio]NAW59192.1 glutathione-regulated potassium-efflux system ancillary protein KefG [Vibrio sp. V36_P2S2PM302]NAX19652.1 glutathione-regulated potassium-efflux system ancillary protein KefG [Vibrio sp. V39_P1S14PM300]NAX26104.1 glutathione-regulated potassium-efflux system ancillary protein KefG [Vibrio sp. V38_P2S17PM301]NAX30990.1 glutathione-regulated potassium-efflux system ancillary prote
MDITHNKPPPRVLVIYAHPEPDNSIANQVMIKKITSLAHVRVHDLYAAYPDFFIDVHAEHQLLLEYDVIVFQHPLYMYSCPALLKEWIDRVLGKGFAFGDGSALAGKYWRSVITTGGSEEAFSEQGYNRYPLDQILQPFELTAALCRMNWITPLVLYWSRNVGDLERYQHAEQYRQWLNNPLGAQGGGDGAGE